MTRIISFIAFTLAISIGISACKKSSNNPAIGDGTYKGTFQRQVSGNGNIANVTLTLNSGNWVGQSETEKYPALCSGTFQCNGANEIIFSEGCIWTADFDWTLILSQKFSLQVSGKHYLLTKDYGNGTKDVYDLMKQ